MIAEIRTRLEAVAALKLVAGAAEFQKAAESNPTAVPAVYVIRNGESGDASPTYSRVRQKVAATVGIVLVVRNVVEAKGGTVGADLETLRAAVRDKLLGWAPAAGYDPLQFVAGTLLAFRDGHAWWQDTYRTQYPISSA